MSRLLFCLVIAVVLAPMPGHALDRFVTVTGESTVAAAPDMAVISVGVTSPGKTAREASESNAKQMTAVLAAIKGAGIDPRDVRTAWLSLHPQYDTQNRTPPRLIGFQASNQVTVKVRDIDKVGGILDSAIGAGANEVSGVRLVVSEQSKLLDKARGDAIADAYRKAELYARAAGAKVGHAIAIAEEGAVPPPYPGMGTKLAYTATPVAAGEQTLRVHVTVSYELTP